MGSSSHLGKSASDKLIATLPKLIMIATSGYMIEDVSRNILEFKGIGSNGIQYRIQMGVVDNAASLIDYDYEAREGSGSKKQSFVCIKRRR